MQPILLISVLLLRTIKAANYDNTYKLTSQTRSSVRELKVTNGGKWGDWVHTTYCPPGTYARGYAQKLDPDQGSGDDSALNNIALFCAGRNSKSYRDITSSPAPGWGKWSDPVFCEEGDAFLTSFILQMDPDQGNGDDSAANFVNFRCRKFAGGDHRIISCGGRYLWGEYGEWSDSCPSGSAICGMKTKWEADQGRMAWNDDTALNDVIFYCCK